MNKELPKKRKITKPKKLLIKKLPPKKQVNLPYLRPSLSEKIHVLFTGFNAGEKSAIQQHRYAHHKNHYWQLFNKSGLLGKINASQNFQSDETLEELLVDGYNSVYDYHLLNYGIGFTSLVERSTKTILDLTMTEKLESVPRLLKEFVTQMSKIS